MLHRVLFPLVKKQILHALGRSSVYHGYRYPRHYIARPLSSSPSVSLSNNTSHSTSKNQILHIGKDNLYGAVSVRLPSATLGDIVEFSSGEALIYGMVVNVWAEVAWIRVFPDQIGHLQIKSHAKIIKDKSLLDRFGIPVGDSLLGSVLDHNLMNDNYMIDQVKNTRRVKDIQPHISDRQKINHPIVTGIKIVDALTPIGQGQAMLVYGESGTGKTSVALDIIISQRETKTKCIYVLLGKKEDIIKRSIQKLKEHNGLEHTTIVAVPSSIENKKENISGFSNNQVRWIDIFSLPLVVSTMGEYYRDKGEDVIVIYDDLNTHIHIYEHMCTKLDNSSQLLDQHILNRSMYSSIIQKSSKLKQSLGGGSLTTLLLLETPDVLPNEMMSISDGQIYLSSSTIRHPYAYWLQKEEKTNKIHQKEYRPPVDLSKSLSRLGSAAQHPMLRFLCKSLRGFLLQRIEAFQLQKQSEQHSSDPILARIFEYFRQSNHTCVPIHHQVIALYALCAHRMSHIMDQIKVEECVQFIKQLIEYVKHNDSQLWKCLKEHSKQQTEVTDAEWLALRLATAMYVNEFVSARSN